MKNSKKGISLIVLVITIIVIIILAAAVILTLNNNNPISEANDARYASDVANMQAVFTNVVGKIMVANQSTIKITPVNFKDTEAATTAIEYTLDYPTSDDNATGEIYFKAGTNEDAMSTNEWVTGKALPNYSSGTETWYIDEEGNVTLKAGNGKFYPENENIISVYGND